MQRTRQSAARPAAPRADANANATPLLYQPVRSARAFEEIATRIRRATRCARRCARWIDHAGLIRLQNGKSGGAFISQASGNAIISSLLDVYHTGSVMPDHLTEARIWLDRCWCGARRWQRGWAQLGRVSAIAGLTRTNFLALVSRGCAA